MNIYQPSTRRRVLVSGALALLLAGCGNDGPAGPAPQPPEVKVQAVQPMSVDLSTELAGRTTGFRAAEVRPQVSGIIKKRLFQEGSEVQEGQPLYQIDDATYKAAYDKAVATLRTTELQAKRYADLSRVNAVSRQAYDDAQAVWKQAKADVEVARINMTYTKVLSPISGRIGRSAVTEGALVTNGQPAALATVQQLDPIYVDIKQSSVDLLRLRKALADGDLKSSGDANASVSLKLEDGSIYEHTGVLQFSEVEVEEGTGSVTLRALFPNPDRTLLPGMFVHAVIEVGNRADVFLVPNQAIMLGKDKSTVYVVDGDGAVQARSIVNERIVDNQWLVSSGLQGGDRIVVEGRQKVRPGMQVRVAHETGPDTAAAATVAAAVGVETR